MLQSGMRLEFRNRMGSGDPLVYVPGIDGSGDYLLGTEQRLAQRFEVITLRTLQDGGANSYAALAASIAGLIETSGIRPVLVLAESFGVAVALQLALEHPRDVCALMLVNGFARFDGHARLSLLRLLAPLVRPWLFHLFRPVSARIGLFGARREDPACKAFLGVESGAIDRAYRQRLKMIQHVDLLDRLNELSLPVAIVASQRDRIVPSVRTGRAMAARIENATIEILPGAGHVVLPLESEPWLERVEALRARVMTVP